MNLTMGSLFDGIGGFPLAAERYGIKTLWASEIEPFPMKVTGRRFPGMAHKGDITKLNGRLLLPVDIICGGSPCQDLSVAGARAGLSGARSPAFYGTDSDHKGNADSGERTGPDRRRHPSPLDVLGECSRRVQQRIAQRGGLPYCAGGDHSDP